MNDLTLKEECLLHEIFFHKVKTRQDILDFANYIKNLPDSLGKDPFPLFHSFADGMYTREVHIPAGYTCVGQIHKKEYFVNVLKGRLWVVSEFGAKEIIAPCSFTAPAGVKHIVYIHEDTVWSDTHKVESTNIDEAENEIFAESYEDFDKYQRIVDDGYSNAIEEIGLNQDQIDKMLINDDLIDQPESDYIEIKDSKIEGFGVFTTKIIKKGARIALARQSMNRTPAGRYANHSDSPNAECVIEDNSAYFIALKTIECGSEITVDYRDVRKKAILLDEGVLCQA